MGHEVLHSSGAVNVADPAITIEYLGRQDVAFLTFIYSR